MTRRADPEPMVEALRAGVRTRFTGTGVTPETADRWLDAWVLEDTGRAPRNGAYWNLGYEWIAEGRNGRRPGW